jgi:tetratricopeptide (TPR) repeat protein
MMRLEAYWTAVTAAILAIVVAPANLVGLPIGIWSLAALMRADVKAAFVPSRGERWVTVATFLALGILGALLIQIGGHLIHKPETKVSRSDSTAAAALAAEGWRLWQGGRPAEAIEKFERAVSLDATNTGAWNGLGWASFNSGKPAEAEKAFQRVIALEAGHPAALNGLGQVYLAQKKFAEAESYLLKASPKAPAAWHGLARLYLLQGNFEQAERWAKNLVDSGQADDLARRMLEAARDKKVSEGLRMMIEPQ